MYLVFDIGATNTRIAKSLDGKTLENTQIFETEKEFESQIQAMSEVVEKLRGEEKIESAAGGVAGSLNKDKTILLQSPNLPSFAQRPLKEELEAIFDCPVYLENDAHLGGLGEANFGAGKGFPIIAFITIGTGIGGARIVDSEIDRNASGFEPGHQIINFEGVGCNCGGKGHLEPYIAGSYLKGIYGANAENIKDEKIWDEISKYLAIGLNNTIIHWSPDLVVLSGSVTQKIPLELIKSHLAKNLFIFPSPDIVKGTLGHEAGLFGGLHLINKTSEDK